MNGILRKATIGVDIGQQRDPTAIAVAQQQDRLDGARHYVVRHLERLPLGTPYPAVAARVAALVPGVRRQLTEYERESWERVDQLRLAIELVIDATGVGRPVVDLMTAAGVPVTAVTFTHGDRRTEGWRDGSKEVTLGKAWLVSRLQVLFQTNRLHLPARHPEADAMLRELLDYEIKIDANAHDSYGAFRTGAHDDLVTALGLAVGAEDRSAAVSSEPYWSPREHDGQRRRPPRQPPHGR